MGALMPLVCLALWACSLATTAGNAASIRLHGLGSRRLENVAEMLRSRQPPSESSQPAADSETAFVLSSQGTRDSRRVADDSFNSPSLVLIDSVSHLPSDIASVSSAESEQNVTRSAVPAWNATLSDVASDDIASRPPSTESDGSPPFKLDKSTDESRFRISRDQEDPPISPSGRNNCAYIFGSLYKWHDKGNLCQHAFYTFLMLPQDGKHIYNEKEQNTLKDLLSSLETARQWQSYGISLQQLASVSECDVDSVNGRTLAQKMVQLGLVSALRTPFAQTYLFSPETLLFLDGEGNNILHLAAMSGDSSTVDVVMELLYKAYSDHKIIKELFEAKNKQGKKPYELLFSPGLSDEEKRQSYSILVQFKSYHRMLTSLSAFQATAEREFGRPKVMVENA